MYMNVHNGATSVSFKRRVGKQYSHTQTRQQREEITDTQKSWMSKVILNKGKDAIYKTSPFI